MTETPAETNPLARIIQLLLLLILTTGFEVGGLVIGIELGLQGMLGQGLVVLYLGLVLERVAVLIVQRPLHEWLDKLREQAIRILASSWWEFAAWALWFVLIQFLGVDSTGVFLLVLLPGLHFQHAFLIAVDTGKNYTQLVFYPGFILFTAIEAVGGLLWLLALNSADISNLNAHLILLVAITIEHIAQGIVLNSLNQQGVLTQIGKAT